MTGSRIIGVEKYAIWPILAQKFFHLLLVNYLILAKFLENFVTNENSVFQLLACNAQSSLNKLFLSYGDDIISSCNLRSHVIEKFFE